MSLSVEMPSGSHPHRNSAVPVVGGSPSHDILCSAVHTNHLVCQVLLALRYLGLLQSGRLLVIADMCSSYLKNQLLLSVSYLDRKSEKAGNDRKRYKKHMKDKPPLPL